MSDTTDHLAAEARARRNARMAAYSQLCIKRDYAEHGENPVSSAGVLISRSLVESIKEQNYARVAIPPTEREGR